MSVSESVPKRRLREALPGLLMAAVSLGLCAAVIEAGARFVVEQRKGRPLTGHGSISRYHPSLGWDKPPGAEMWLRRPEYEVLLKINSRGLRGPERDYEKPVGTRRVLLLGDSFAEGYTVSEEATIRAVLERLLNESGCGRHEVINAGIAAYSTDQEYLFFASEAHKYQPDLVVLLFFHNDLYFNSAPATVLGEAKPYFEVAGERLVLRNSPVPAPPEGERLRRPETRPYRLKPWRGSMALRLLSNRTSEGSPSLHRFLARLALVEPMREEPPSPEYWPFGPGPRPEVVDMWKRTAAILGALKQEVEKRAGRLVVFYVPVRFEVNDRAWELTRARYRLGPRWNRDRVFETLRRTCAALGLPLLDPREALRQAERSRRPAYLSHDGHWSETGHATAARELASFVTSQEGCAGSVAARR